MNLDTLIAEQVAARKKTVDGLIGIEAARLALLECTARLEPPPPMTTSEFADEHIYLPLDNSARPGKFKTELTPYMREPLDLVFDPDSDIQEHVWKFAAQLAKSTGLNALKAYKIAREPGPTGHCQPSLNMVKNFADTRFQAMIDASPLLRDLIVKNTQLLKTYKGGAVNYFFGSNSPGELSGKPLELILGDEVDRWATQLRGEGEPLELLKARAKAFSLTRRYVWAGTPTGTLTSVIHRLFEGSDQRQYWVCCPECDHHHLLLWSGIRWERDGSTHKPETAMHVCPNCGVLHSKAACLEMGRTGIWKPSNPDVKNRAGFHLNELHSPFVTFEETVIAWLEAMDQPEKKRSWLNLCFAEAVKEDVSMSTVDEMLERREPYTPKLIPDGVEIISLGGDVQGDRFECEIVGWGSKLESWSLEYLVLPGDMTQDALKEAIRNLLLNKVYQRRDGQKLQIEYAGIDAGFLGDDVLELCESVNAFGFVGRDNNHGRIMTKEAQEGEYQWAISPTALKNELAQNLKIEQPGPGYCHFPNHYTKKYFEMLLSERQMLKRVNGRRVFRWEKIHEHIANEALDCRNYARAALHVDRVDDYLCDLPVAA